MKLSPSMHVRLVGLSFMMNRHDDARITIRTAESLKRRGLIDDTYRRTQAGLDYVQQYCESLDDRIRANYPDCTMIYSDAGLLSAYKSIFDLAPSVYVYQSCNPLLVKNGNIRQPVAVLSATYMWEIEVKMVWHGSIKKRAAGRFLTLPIRQEDSYEYAFNREKTEETIDNTFAEVPLVREF